MDAALTRVSKRLSRVLRHDPGSVGMVLDPQGWVDVDVLLAALAAHGPTVSRAEFDTVVAENNKCRFALRQGPDGREQVRASQGHSVPVDLGLDVRVPPPQLFHGTSAAALPSIRTEGLHRGRRHHVHLSADVDTALVVGRRRRGEVSLLAVDSAAMAAAGFVFLRSANGVWLTEHVPPAFLRELPSIPATRPAARRGARPTPGTTSPASRAGGSTP